MPCTHRKPIWDCHTDCRICRTCNKINPCGVCQSWSSWQWEKIEANRLKKEKERMARDKNKAPGQSVSKKPRKPSLDSEAGSVKDILIGAGAAEFKTPRDPGKKPKSTDLFKDPPTGQSSP